jgi:hypothetical protein
MMEVILMGSTFDMEAIAQAVAKAVVIAMHELQPNEKEEMLLDGYVPADAVKSYKQTDDYPVYLDVAQTAAMLNVSKSKAYELFRSKNFPQVTWGKTKRMVDKADLIKYLKERRGGYLLDEYSEDDAE